MPINSRIIRPMAMIGDRRTALKHCTTALDHRCVVKQQRRQRPPLPNQLQRSTRLTRILFLASTLLATMTTMALMMSSITVQATVLHELVDVKGNEAIREVRIMYDLYYHPQTPHANTQSTSSSSSSASSSSLLNYPEPSPGPVSTGGAQQGAPRDTRYYYPSRRHHQQESRAYEVNIPLYPWSSHRQPQQPPHAQYPAAAHLALHHHAPPTTLANHNAAPAAADSLIGQHPQYLVEQGLARPVIGGQIGAGNKLPPVNAHQLIRGKPMFVEVDFVPKYIPQPTHSVSVSVTLPAHIRGRPWMLGYHQEAFPTPTCRLCTNHNQSFTLPVTLFLPDDGWCPEGRVPTIWKIESVPREGTTRPAMDQTDLILAYGYDDLRQLYLANDANATTHCRGISEAIVA